MGASAFERAELAGQIIEKRLSPLFPDLRIDYIGLNSVNRLQINTPSVFPEIRLRIAGKAVNQEVAALIGEEVEALYTNGPAGGGGVRKYVNEIVGIVSILLKRANIYPKIAIFES